ncbi:ABC-type phosphate transport system permease subunit [Arthrobacter sp. 2762]
MEDNAAPQPSDTNNPGGNHSAGPGASEHSAGRSLVAFARPALIAGAVIAVICIGLLIVIFALDSFNATAYSVTGKSVNDATDEARDIRDLYSGARIGGIIALVISGVVALAAAIVLYLNRGSAPTDEDDDGEDYDLDDLTGR